ncbi:capsular polysaccharide synthesis protein [Lactobacillus helveticus]|uniref:capsular polysaccharide synthesis protein n=1 Tax=Lactobacillus helveticus TaxID=1587 RepID=UPI0015658DB8|nr:capsular polysaccharide synthesis protein [Lactobacillus helveticus]NRO93651.1 hypothetical protein [Lactobacillus helveticus]
MNNSEIIDKDYNKSFISSKILRKLPISSRVSRKYNKYRQFKINKKLYPIFQIAQQKITQKNEIKDCNIIWVFWWQGKDKMTPLSKKCYKNILKNKGNRIVILLTKENIRQYATLPEYIYTKIKSKKISLTHLSDILRFNLLNNYGGLWMDATLYVTDSLDKFSKKELFTCSGYEDKYLFNISYGRWTGFFIGGPSHLSLFQFMDNFFQEYWKYNDKLIDYFLIDYALNYAWNKNLSKFRTISKKYNMINPRMFELQGILNNKFDIRKINKLTLDTVVFKLSNKKPINYNNKSNFYNHL